MQVDEVFGKTTNVSGTKFTTRGLPVALTLGDSRHTIQGEFTGSGEFFAPVFGLIDIPVNFLFAGAQCHIRVYAVVGIVDPAFRLERAISFRTTRPGALGGSLTLDVSATLDQFEFVDETNPGGLGAKTVIIEGYSSKVRIVARGNSNKSSYTLRIAGSTDGYAVIDVNDGPSLTVKTEMEDGWWIYTVTDES